MTPETLAHIEQVILALVALAGAVTALVQRVRAGRAERETEALGRESRQIVQDALELPRHSPGEAQAAASHAVEAARERARVEAKRK